MKLGIGLSHKDNIIMERVNSSLLSSSKDGKPRDYMGCSVIGKECDRQLWYEYHAPIRTSDPRIHRIFRLGHIIEKEVLELLRMAGFTVHSADGDDSQYGGRDEEIGYNIDGVLMMDDTPYLLEIKSASDKRFNQMVKVGVKISDPTYYVQMITYMKYMELDRGLFIAYNKNTSDIHVEVVVASNMEANYFINRGKEIVRMDIEPERKYKTSAFYSCKMCSYREVCWK
jgi:CRISPR/Cas system-associated exonuclease Cas4 (RecB family)